MAVIHANDAGFKKEVIDEKATVLVDFYAQWCGPCKMVAPIVEELSKEYEGKIKFVKVDVDDAPGVATKYGIMSIPTLMFFKKGKVMSQIVGAVSKSYLKKKIEENL